MPAKKENRMRKEFEEKDIHQEVRLNKYLSEAGVCSRREADRLIEEGKVFVDGVRAENGRKVTENDAAEGRKWFCWRFTNQRA